MGRRADARGICRRAGRPMGRFSHPGAARAARHGSARWGGKRCLAWPAAAGSRFPVFAALGARCTVLDFSAEQCRSERLVRGREGYRLQILQRDMTRPFPFADGTFDLIFHPVSNCYIEKVEPVFRNATACSSGGGACFVGWILESTTHLTTTRRNLCIRCPFNPLRDEKLFDECIRNGWGIQFSHTLEEQLGGQLKAGFRLTDLYEDTNGSGRLRDLRIPSFVATRLLRNRRAPSLLPAFGTTRACRNRPIPRKPADTATGHRPLLPVGRLRCAMRY